MVAARPFHWTYENLIVKLMMIGDTPALLAGGLLVDRPAVSLSEEAHSYLLAAVWLAFGFVQWWLIGFLWARRRVRTKG